MREEGIWFIEEDDVDVMLEEDFEARSLVVGIADSDLVIPNELLSRCVTSPEQCWEVSAFGFKGDDARLNIFYSISPDL